MTEGFYEKPRHAPHPLTPVKIACVIPAYIPDGQTKNYGHYVENKLETIKMNLAAHRHYRPGISYDILLFDNSSPDLKGSAWLAAQGARKRINWGFSFGCWKEAWKIFRDQYDFYLFTEDDIAPSCDDWLLEIMGKFFLSPDVGAVGSFVEGRSPHEAMSSELWDLMRHEHPMMYNFDGAFTFTSSRVLNQVEKVGGLPVFPCGPGEYAPTINECVFQQPILQLGYRLTSFDDGDHCVVHGSEVFTGDIQHGDKPLAPLTNINGRHHIPKVRDNYSWYLDGEI